MSRRSNIRKRERQQRRFTNRPKPKPVEKKPSISPRGLISEAALEKLSPLAQALRNQQRIIQL